MFGSKNKKVSVEVDTIIGASTRVIGNIHYSGRLRIDGEIAGNVVAEKEGSVLNISASGRIEGNVQACRIVLNGEVVGDVYAMNDIQLAANARVRGNLYYDKIEMERGAEVNGKMIHGKPQVVNSKPVASVSATSPVDNVVAAATTP